MRIVQVANHAGPDRGGAERLVRGLHSDLLDQGWASHLVSIEACDLGGLENAESLGFHSPYHPAAAPSLIARLRRLAGPGDIIHAHLFPTSAYVALGRRLGLIAAGCVFTEHNTHNRRRETAAWRPVDRLIYGAFDSVFCISDGVRNALTRAQPQLEGRTATIMNGATLRFHQPLERDGIRRDPRAPLRILSIGRLSGQKNYATALRALAGLGDRNFRYTVLGEGADREALEEQATTLGLAGQVDFKGHVLSIEPFLREADIFLLPSLWEGFGLAAVEAMNAALPVVASDVPGLREVVGEDGRAAVLVTPTDAGSMTSALRSLIDDPERRLRMGDEGFRRSLAFDRRRMAHEYVAAYRDLSAGGAVAAI